MAKKSSKPQPKEKAPREAKEAKKHRTKGDHRREANYVLPKGCNYEEIASDLKLYKVFEFEDQVFTIRSTGGNEEEGIPPVNKAVPISNFICHIESHIIHTGGALKLITIRNVDKEEFTYHVPGDALLTLPMFRKVTAGDKGNFDWSGSELDYRNYLRRMQDHMGSGRLIRELGMQPEGFFVFRNMVLNGREIPISQYGCFDHNGSRYYVPAGNIIELQDRGKFSNARRLVYVKSPITWHQLTSKMRQVHREHCFIPIVFAVATVFRDIIYERLRGFLMVYLYGEPGSGKDQVIEAARRLFGHPQPPLPLSGDNTGPGMVNMFAEFLCIPQLFSEWKNDMKMERMEMVSAIYDGVGRRRGQKTSDVSSYSTDSVPIDCSAFVTGNDYPNVLDKVMTRFLIDEMDKDSFSPEERKHYDELGDMMQQGYSHLLAPFVACREEFQRDWFSTYFKQAQALTYEAMKEHQVHGRMMTNINVLLSVFMFFEERLQWAFTRQELLKHLVMCTVRQQQKRQQGDAVSSFWSCFIAGYRKRKLVDGVHYRIDGNELSFFWEELHGVYTEVFQELYRKDTPLNKVTMMAKLKKHACYLRTDGSKRIGSRRNSAMVIDLTKVGTNLKGLLSDVPITDKDDTPTPASTAVLEEYADAELF